MFKSSFHLVLTYDDVLLKPGYSEILPSEVITESFFSRNISIKIPIASSAMDTVTESKTAITMAKEGGIGVIHKNLSIEKQAEEVQKVKKFEAGLVADPVTVKADDTLFDVLKLISSRNITGVPVVDDQSRIVGILTSRDMQFENNHSKKVRDIMTSKNKLITAPEHIPLEQAKKLLHKHRIEKLPVIDREGKLKGLITIKDILKDIDYPNASQDSLGRLRCAAAIGVGEKEYERAKALVKAGVDALVVDTAHGHSRGVIGMVKKLKQKLKIDIVAGNVRNGEGLSRTDKSWSRWDKSRGWTWFHLYDKNYFRSWSSPAFGSFRLLFSLF